MYTVKELIEALKKCPEDYKVVVGAHNLNDMEVDMVGIDHDEKVVGLFCVGIE